MQKYSYIDFSIQIFKYIIATKYTPLFVQPFVQ